VSKTKKINVDNILDQCKRSDLIDSSVVYAAITQLQSEVIGERNRVLVALRDFPFIKKAYCHEFAIMLREKLRSEDDTK
jgi:hypothetical protein